MRSAAIAVAAGDERGAAGARRVTQGDGHGLRLLGAVAGGVVSMQGTEPDRSVEFVTNVSGQA